MVSLKIIPMDLILEKVFQAEPSDEDETEEFSSGLMQRFSEVGGMKSVSIISNMGFVFVFISMLFAFAVILLLYKCISKSLKSTLLDKIFQYVSNKIFYNAILRSIL
mmetsp:Transcript_17042/g.16265  ORF Transcript_17042/g.16265 Transcript_17042/m.16265 type:complete len:107 (+) Transcript_17042:1161-1481(+)